MIHSITGWNLARSPNYETNTDLIYPYSEVPYIGNYKLVRLPLPKDNFIEHIDYWGEGKISVKEGTSGYNNCYNVNHHYQLVSNGPDRDRKIPNRIPVISYTDCDTSSYIRDNTVKLVTVMGAPINKSCAKDITRMVNADIGKVVVYGFGSNDPDIRNLEEALKAKELYLCESHDLNELLKSVTLFDKNDHRVYLNVTDLGDELFKNVTNGNIDNALNISKTFKINDKCNKITEVVNKLLTYGAKNIMEYAYKLWDTDNRDIVNNNFPLSFKLIFNKDFVKIMDRNNMYALNLERKDSKEDTLVIGNVKDKSTEKVRWQFVLVLENNNVYFRIVDKEQGTFMKLTDKENKRVISNPEIDSKSIWILEPLKVSDDILFFIINKDSNLSVKFDDTTDGNGNKLLIGHEGPVRDHPELYGWYIAPW